MYESGVSKIEIRSHEQFWQKEETLYLKNDVILNYTIVLIDNIINVEDLRYV